MKNLKFSKHLGYRSPVPKTAYVVYRTTSEDTKISHVHVRMLAGLLNWSTDLQFGRIHSYCVVPQPNLPGKQKPLQNPKHRKRKKNGLLPE